MTVQDSWRGVAPSAHDDVEEAVTAGLAGVFRARSRRLLSELLRPHRRALFRIGVLVVIGQAASLAGPLLVRVGIDRGIPALRGGDGGPAILIAVAAALLGAAVLQAVASRAFFSQFGRVGEEVVYVLRVRLYEHFCRLSLSFHERFTSGRVIARLTSDVESLSELMHEGIQALVVAVLSVVTIGAVLVALDPPLGMAALVSLLPLFAVTQWYRRSAERAYRAIREAVALVIIFFTESLSGIRAVHAFRREGRNHEIFADLNERYRRSNAVSWRLAGVYGPGLKLLGHVTTAAVLAYGALRVIDGATTVGTLTASLLYLRRFFDPMQDLSQFYTVFQSAAAALEKISGVLDTAPTVAEPASPTALPPVVRGAGRERGIVFEAVGFGYRPDRMVLSGFDLRIPAGQTVALVGETGAGKSTVARLLARFWDPTSGRITLDGVDLRHLADADLRQAVVTVTQEGFLFSGSVADNIALGRPDAVRGDIEAAATAAGAHHFIAALSEGYDTEVGKRGASLSAGERQLVAIARAFLTDPRVLILDEATSSLDLPGERTVQHALARLLSGRTAVVIAHRLSTLAIADRVLVMEDGRILEDGSPSDLVARGGRYALLHAAWRRSVGRPV